MLYNYETDQLFSESHVVTVLKTQKLRWAGHVVRIEDNTDKKVTFQKPFGSRRKGRPNSRRVDDIEVDLKTGREWVEKALDRGEWKNVLEEAKAQRKL
jgi:hypothetical protein